MQIISLTRLNKKGEVYHRTEVVEAQINDALNLPITELRRRACLRDFSSPEYFQEETLVYLIRYFHNKEGYENIQNDLAKELVERCTLLAKRRIKSLPPQAYKDAYDYIISQIFSQILDFETDKGDFLQVRFRVVVDRLGTVAFRKYKKERQQAKKYLLEDMPPGLDYEPDFEGEGISGSSLIGNVRDKSPNIEELLLLKEGLYVLDERSRTLFILRNQGWEIENQDPSVMTISRYFNKSSRTIRNWLRQVEETLKDWQLEGERENGHGQRNKVRQ